MDLVLSIKSMAFHYPLENYLDLLRRVCTQNTEFIFDISTERYQLDSLSEYFEKLM